VASVLGCPPVAFSLYCVSDLMAAVATEERAETWWRLHAGRGVPQIASRWPTTAA